MLNARRAKRRRAKRDDEAPEPVPETPEDE